MFNKIKNMAQAKSLANEIKNEEVVMEKEGVKVVVRGDFTMKKIVLNPSLETTRQEEIIQECFNEAIKELQMMMAKKMMGMGM